MDIDEIIREIQPPRKVPKIKPGDIVKIQLKVKEKEKERIQTFEGIVIKISGGRRHNATFTVRKIAQGVGVERIYPLFSTLIKKINVIKSSKTRRAKLYFLRKKIGKAAKMKEKAIRGDVVDLMKAVEEEEKQAEEEKKIEVRTEKGEEEKDEEKKSSKEKTKEAGSEIEANQKTSDSKPKS